MQLYIPLNYISKRPIPIRIYIHPLLHTDPQELLEQLGLQARME